MMKYAYGRIFDKLKRRFLSCLICYVKSYCFVLILIFMVIPSLQVNAEGSLSMLTDRETIQLPEPRLSSDISLEYTLQHRRSIREFSSQQAISLAELAQLLWAAQGITNSAGYRTAPSAGALYPLQVYAVVGNVDGITSGVYEYQASGHALQKLVDGDMRKAVSSAALNQSWIKQSAVVLIFSAIERRTTRKYGQRGIRYIHIEIGHAAQNVFLQAVALNLGAAVVGAFDDKKLNQLLALPRGEEVLYIMPIGKP